MRRSTYAILCLLSILLVQARLVCCEGEKEGDPRGERRWWAGRGTNDAARATEAETTKPTKASRWVRPVNAIARVSPTPGAAERWREAVRRSEESLRGILSRISGPGEIVFPLFSNLAWVDFAANAFRQLETAGVRRGVFVYAMDDATCERLVEVEPRAPCYLNETMQFFEKGDLLVGTRDYVHMVDHRLVSVLWIQEHTDRHTFLLDTDTWIREDPRRHVDLRNFDLAFQQEVPWEQKERRMPQLNGGCWFLRNSDISREWLRVSIEYMRETEIDDQRAMNYALDYDVGDRIRTKAFPRDSFPNGFLRYVVRQDEMARSWPVRQPVFAHANWILGLNGKFMRLFDDGAWRLDTHDYGSRPAWTRDTGYIGGDFDPTKVLKWSRRRCQDPASSALPVVSDGTPEESSRGFRFSYREQVDRVLKLLHLGLLLNRPVSYPKVLCRPSSCEESCGPDLFLDFQALDKNSVLLPDRIDRLPHVDRYLDLADLSELVPSSSTTSPSPSDDPVGKRGDLEVWWLVDDEDLSYSAFAKKYPLNERRASFMSKMLVASGLVSNQVLSVLKRFESRKFACVYDDPLRGDTETVVRTLLDRVETASIPLYWVHVDPFARPQNDSRRHRVEAEWIGDVVSAYSALWYGASELNGHVLPGYVQYYACNLATKIFVNVDTDVRERWFVEKMCSDRPERCVFLEPSHQSQKEMEDASE